MNAAIVAMVANAISEETTPQQSLAPLIDMVKEATGAGRIRIGLYADG